MDRRFLHEFYAVTLTSVYRVWQEENRAIAQKIALFGESSIPVGGLLKNGSVIAICRDLETYYPRGDGDRIENHNIRDLGGHTMPIVALFLKQDQAEACAKVPNLKPNDDRWSGETFDVIEAIGKDHPVFKVCRHPVLSLVSPPR